MAREIRFYRTVTGRCPVEEFLDSLSGKQAKKIAWVLSLIEDLDVVPSRYFKKLVNTEGIWEARVDAGRDTFRLLAFIDRQAIVVLTLGFKKKSQKTPKKFIALSEQRKAEYFRRSTL